MNNGIIKCCTYNSNYAYRDTIFKSSNTAIFLYGNAMNNTQHTLFYRSEGNSLQMFHSNFSDTKSNYQGCISSNKVYFHEQKYVNFYKCGNDTGGASISIDLGKSEVSYSNYIDIESGDDYAFILVGYGSETIFKRCFLRIKSFVSFLDTFNPKSNETVYFEDCTIIGKIQYNVPYLRTKNVIISPSKIDYTFANIPYLETDIIDFDETILYHCYQNTLNYFLLFLVLTSESPG